MIAFALVPVLLPAATSVAVLPVGAEQLSLDVVPVLEKLDADLRIAVGSERGVALLDAEVTNGQVTGARSLGVVCGPDDVACVTKLCALAGVERVVQSTARFADDGTIALRLLVVHKSGASALSEVVLSADDSTRRAEIAALVRRAQILTLPPSAPPSVAVQDPPAPAPAPPAPSAAPTPDAPQEESAPSLLLAGVAVAATGGVLAIGAGAGALVLDASLAEPEPYEDRSPKMTTGRALVVVAGASTLVAAAGAALIVVASVGAE